MFQIQCGKGRGKYKVRQSHDSEALAWRWYNMLNTHSGYKKRLVDTSTGRVIARYISG